MTKSNGIQSEKMVCQTSKKTKYFYFKHLHGVHITHGKEGREKKKLDEYV